MQAVRVPRFGGPEVLEVVAAPEPACGEDQLVVEVHAAALNVSDLHARAGTGAGPTPPFWAGVEGAGLAPDGRRIAFLAERGAHATRAAIDAAACVELPEDLSFEEGAGFLTSYLTAFHALATAARVQHGDVVLVHAAAGGLGTALVQIARELGARVIGTASTDEKRRRIAALGAEPRGYDELGGLAPDVIVDPVGGRVTIASLAILPPFGRLVLAGAAAGERVQLDVAPLIDRSQCVHGVHLDAVLADPGLVRRALAVLLPWLERGKIALVPDVRITDS
jgi:NADPH2:quinone reductase